MSFEKNPVTRPDVVAKYSQTPGERPDGLLPGELAVNAADGCAFAGGVNGQPQTLPVAVGFNRIETLTESAYAELVANTAVNATTLYVVTADPE
jgi:hypothetical protein